MSTKAEKVAALQAQIDAAEDDVEKKEDTKESAERLATKTKNPADKRELEDIAQASEDTIATLVEEIRELRKQLAEAHGDEPDEGEPSPPPSERGEDRGFFANIWGGK